MDLLVSIVPLAVFRADVRLLRRRAADENGRRPSARWGLLVAVLGCAGLALLIDALTDLRRRFGRKRGSPGQRGRGSSSQRVVRSSAGTLVSDFRPTIWHGRLAFARLPSIGPRVPRLYARSRPDRPAPRVPTPHTRLASAATVYLARLDLRNSRLISSWEYREAQCRSQEAASVTGDAASEVFLGSTRTQRRFVEGCDQDDPVDVRDGSWAAERVSVIVVRPTAAGFERVSRLYDRTGRLLRKHAVPPSATPQARDESVQYFVTFRRGQDGGADAYDVVRSVAATETP